MGQAAEVTFDLEAERRKLRRRRRRRWAKNALWAGLAALEFALFAGLAWLCQ
jgi:uncharacterized membrane protein